jgi:hypothetical protein
VHKSISLCALASNQLQLSLDWISDNFMQIAHHTSKQTNTSKIRKDLQTKVVATSYGSQAIIGNLYSVLSKEKQISNQE